MIAIRHTGIYVDDIVKLEKFYMSVFGMIPVCSGEPDQSSLFDELLCHEGVRIITTKLITLYGKKNGQGDMLELVKVLGEVGTIPKLPDNYPISMTGMAHIAFQIDDMQKTVEQIQEGGGFQKTDIYQMKSGNLCCFCRDPERNWIELIQRRKEDMDKLKGKTALITGGTSGIGGGIALIFAEEGANVIVIGRNAERGNAFVTEAGEKGLKITYYQCDVTVKNELCSLHKELLSSWGSIDILVSNAGMLRTGALDEITDEDWDAVYNANVKSAMYLCQEFITDLRRRHGVILFNASINGLSDYIKGAKSYMYATSKAALIQFSRYMAKNYAPDVRVNCLCPGMTETNLFTNRDFSRFKGCNLLDRMAKPEEIARVALFLVSEDSSFMTGSVVVADGGETLK